jgi:hypothetical protein
MPTDRYGLSLSTTSRTAGDAAVEGCAAKLTNYPGAIAALGDARRMPRGRHCGSARIPVAGLGALH